jgi:hypothetical protein
MYLLEVGHFAVGVRMQLPDLLVQNVLRRGGCRTGEIHGSTRRNPLIIQVYWKVGIQGTCEEEKGEWDEPRLGWH